ncbi:MAG: hypothetical protein CMP67_07300 [Flavobacteriales bacterium]|nr:hypothetical protein [Flavobacteriales bacterium]MBO73006.1 hypothetical protein [Flavobacteriales bacterium]
MIHFKGVFFFNRQQIKKGKMEAKQFYQTEMSLNRYGLKITSELNRNIRAAIQKDKNSNDLESNVREILGHIYLVNQYLLKKIEKLGGLLNEGLVNQENEYVESDLNLVETMLNVSIFKITSCTEFNVPVYSSLEELELRLAVQFRKLVILSNTAPSEFANNYKTEMKVIPGIKLDIYQLIYFAMKHSGHHLGQISTLIRIEEVLDSNYSVAN